jgi:hypothetical protein
MVLTPNKELIKLNELIGRCGSRAVRGAACFKVSRLEAVAPAAVHSTAGLAINVLGNKGMVRRVRLS